MRDVCRRAGGFVAFSRETVWGLGADLMDAYHALTQIKLLASHYPKPPPAQPPGR